MSKEIERQVEEQAKLWSAIVPPSEAAHAFARGLAVVAEGFELTRGQMAFEEEPSSFEAALQEIKETAP
jgi:hypothetical protein